MEYEKVLEKLDLHRALVRKDIDTMIITCYSSVFLEKLQITLLSIEHNIKIIRKTKPRYMRQISHLLLPLDETIF